MYDFTAKRLGDSSISVTSAEIEEQGAMATSKKNTCPIVSCRYHFTALLAPKPINDHESLERRVAKSSSTKARKVSLWKELWGGLMAIVAILSVYSIFSLVFCAKLEYVASSGKFDLLDFLVRAFSIG